MKNSDNKVLGKRGKGTRGFGLERMKSVVMGNVSKYLQACGGSCGESKGDVLTLVEAQLGPMDGCRMGQI